MPEELRFVLVCWTFGDAFLAMPIDLAMVKNR